LSGFRYTTHIRNMLAMPTPARKEYALSVKCIDIADLSRQT
jgi:hypothetical protein